MAHVVVAKTSICWRCKFKTWWHATDLLLLWLNGPSFIPKIIADAAVDANRQVKFVERFEQAADHPTDTAYPEGFYLKGFACKCFNRSLAIIGTIKRSFRSVFLILSTVRDY